MYVKAVCEVDNQSAGMRYEAHPYLATMGLVFTIIITPITLGVKKLLEKYGPSAK